jgi:hypothetical protein
MAIPSKKPIRPHQTKTTTETVNTRRKAYQYRLYPTPSQEKALLRQLEACRELYNAALQERRDTYKV